MERVKRALRLAIFPLLFVLGAAALGAAYFEWKRFFGELYLEEMQAIEAAVAGGATVEYRRAGEPKYRVARSTSGWMGRTLDPEWERERTTVPDNAPFLGRVESVRFRDQPSRGIQPLVTQAVRDGLLRLPGLKSFEGRREQTTPADLDPPSSEPEDDLEQALGQPLPPLPQPTLTLAATETPIPRGEALDASARAELAATIAASWKRERPLKTYIARSAYRPNDSGEFVILVTEIADGERFASRIERPSTEGHPYGHVFYRAVELEPLRLLDDRRAYLFDGFGGERLRIASFDRRLGGEAFDPKRFAPALLSPEELPRLNVDDSNLVYGGPRAQEQEDPLGGDGSDIVGIERLDDRRLRLELAPQTTNDRGTTLIERTEMIVREDFDFAVERFDVTHSSPTDDDRSSPLFVISVLRRLARAGEAVYAQETLRSQHVRRREPADAPRQSPIAQRTLTTIVPAPEIPASVFDPLSYDRSVWPEPQPLPTVRTYRTLWALGAGLMATSLLGPLALRLRSRRRHHALDAAPETGAAGLRLPRVRFGLAALFAAALAVISVAGAVKQTRDVVLRDVEALRRIDGWAEIERHEASFPWSLVSTPAFPIDAPLKRIVIRANPESEDPPVSKEAVKELVADPRLNSFHDRSGQDEVPKKEYVLADAAAALERSLPELPERIPLPETALWLERMPQGEELAVDERAAFVGRLSSAWKQAADKFPQSYLLVESHDYGDSPEARATLRSGERCWSMGGVDSCFVSSQDKTYRYRFGASDDGFSLVERTRLGTTALDVDPPFPTYPHANRVGFGPGQSPLLIHQPGRAADPPFAFPRYLDDEIENFHVVARAALDPARIVRVSRLDDDRLRVDFDPIEVEVKGKVSVWGNDVLGFGNGRNGGQSISSTDEIDLLFKIAALSLIVREDLDCAVERTYCKAYPYEVSSGSTPESSRSIGSMPSREFYFTNQLVRTAEGFVVPESSRVGDDRGGDRTWWDSRFAYDFSPKIDERLFSSPSLAHPDPYPVVERGWPITWPFVTGALSLLIFAALGGTTNRERPHSSAGVGAGGVGAGGVAGRGVEP